MGNKCKIDECLEHLWYMREEKNNKFTELEVVMEETYDETVVRELETLGHINIDVNNNFIELTDSGADKARKIIRAHRLAERLLYDVIGSNIEKGACEFEHMVTPELIDSICILLGHPKECPHGLPIPAGECCKVSAKSVESSVKNLQDMEVGQSARIAYINCANDGQLHRLNSLQVRPGIHVKLHQKYPTFIIECEGAKVAIDETIAENICVWGDGSTRYNADATAKKGTHGRLSKLFRGKSK